MKISYRTHPILNGIKNGALKHLLYDPEKLFSSPLGPRHNANLQELLKISFPATVLRAKNNIQHLSINLLKGIDHAFDKLNTLEVISLTPEISGIFLSQNRESEIYCVFNKNNSVKGYFFYFKENVLFASITCVYYKEDNIIYCDSEAIDTSLCTHKAEFLATRTLAKINFLQYAEIETKVLPATAKTKDFNCKYVNDTTENIKFLNICWNTTLHQPNSFKVKAHLRWQPFGENKSGRKLIWINDFQKHGYTAPARKLKENASTLQL